MTHSPPKFSVAAIASCALGLVGVMLLSPLGSFLHHGLEETFLGLLVCPVAAVVCGFISLLWIKRTAGVRGRGFAFAGLILGGGMVALVFTFAGLRGRAVHHFRICGDNIHMIEEHLSPDDPVPVCPGGGTYTYTVVATGGVTHTYTIATNGFYPRVQCSKHGDLASCRMGI